MAGINLLPTELKPKGYIIELSKHLKKIALIAFGIFLAVGSVSLGILIVFSRLSSNSLKTQEELKTNIKSLEQTEQSLLLVKDRIEKIGIVKDFDSAQEEIEILKTLSRVSQESSIEEASLITSSAKITFNFTKLSSITSFIDSVQADPQFSTITLESFVFQPDIGYSVEISFVKK